MMEGVSLSREDGIIVYTNAAADRLFGYAPGELVGQLLWFDADGNSGAAAEMIADLQAVAVLTAADIWLL